MELVETAIFTRQVQEQWSDDEYRTFQLYLLTRPAAGRRIPGAGGLRKVRWRWGGRGKRGGVRVVYHWKVAADRIYLLFLYPKHVRADLTPREIRVLRQLVRGE